MAKDRPVSSLITPSSRLRLLVWKVSNLSLNSYLPHIESICCMSSESLCWDSLAMTMAGALWTDYEAEGYSSTSYEADSAWLFDYPSLFSEADSD